jgi:hypothetical protein
MGFFQKKIIKNTLKGTPSSVWIVLESIHEGMASPYWQSDAATLHVLHCILWQQRMQGLQQTGTPYQMKFTDNWGNILRVSI